MKQKQQWKQHRHKNKGVMVRKEKKKHSQLEWPPNINPLPPLYLEQSTGRLPPTSQGAPLCVRQSTTGTDARWTTHSRRYRDGLALGFGAIYCQLQQTAICAELSVSESWGQGINFRSRVKRSTIWIPVVTVGSTKH